MTDIESAPPETERTARDEERSVSDVFTAALQGHPCRVIEHIDVVDGEDSGKRSGNGVPVDGVATDAPFLPVDRWNGHVDDADRRLLAHCVGATLDVGCGPGRMCAHLAAEGHVALGIDMVAEAVAQTRDRGVTALRRDVFAPLPAEGRWETALLADGNIGIGGDPVALLSRLVAVIAPGGRVVVDLAGPGVGLETGRVRLALEDGPSRPFEWAWVGPDGIAGVAASAGLRVRSLHEHEDRWFAVLERDTDGARPRR